MFAARATRATWGQKMGARERLSRYVSRIFADFGLRLGSRDSPNESRKRPRPSGLGWPPTDSNLKLLVKPVICIPFHNHLHSRGPNLSVTADGIIYLRVVPATR